MSNHNRDINRQNKASSVIDATIYSYITKDKIDTLLRVCESVNSDPNNVLSQSSRMQLTYALNNLSSKPEEDSNELSSSHYMKCSTYIKGGAKSIAKSEFSRMKKAIETDETNLLYDSASHLTPHMVKLQESISQTPGKHPCIIDSSCTSSQKHITVYPNIFDLSQTQPEF